MYRMEPIKNCPHCGGSAELSYTHNQRNDIFSVFVRCNICNAHGPIFECIGINPERVEYRSNACKKAVTAWNKTPENEPIKNCPYCGGKGTLVATTNENKNQYNIFVECDNCSARGSLISIEKMEATKLFKSEESKKAIKAWNSRKNLFD